MEHTMPELFTQLAVLICGMGVLLHIAKKLDLL
jgi:hypothetical protein